MSALEFYLITLAIYACINGILVLGFNLQFGTTGILNFAYYLLVAVGAYAAGVAALPPASASGATFDHYIGGFNLAFPWDLLFGVAAALIFAAVLGSVSLLRLRADYLAMTLFAAFLGLWQLSDNVPSLLNGDVGLISIPGPWQDTLSPSDFQVAFLVLCVFLLLAVYITYRRVDSSPLGRALRAVRDDEQVVVSLGYNPWRIKMVAFLLGAVAAGLGGALFALYLGGWGPNGWQITENLVLLAAVIVGGRGRNAGVLLGSLLVLTGIVQGSRFIPTIADRPDLIGAIQGLVIGAIFLAFIWWRPQGILPERKERFAPEKQAATAIDHLTKVGSV